MKIKPLFANIKTGLMMMASVLSIATARLERDPQSCGMMIVQTRKKNGQPQGKEDHL